MSEPANTARKTVTVEEAARALGIGRNLAYGAVKAGEIPSIKIGKRLLIPSAVLERLLAGNHPTEAA